MGRLTTHALDLKRGKPADGLRIELWRAGAKLKTVVTNPDGRTDEPLLVADEFTPDTYELVFYVGEYFDAPVEERFLDRVPVRFSITDAGEHYHVPLLMTPWAYQTYRGG